MCTILDREQLAHNDAAIFAGWRAQRENATRNPHSPTKREFESWEYGFKMRKLGQVPIAFDRMINSSTTYSYAAAPTFEQADRLV